MISSLEPLIICKMKASDYSPDQLKKLGLTYVGFGPSRQESEQRNINRFRGHYGVCPEAIKLLIVDLEMEGRKIDVKKLFMTISWLRLYDTAEVMAGRWDWGEEHCQSTVHEYTGWIAKLKSRKIGFNGLNPNCKFLAVDCIHTRCQEFRCDPDSKWWSHKHNGPGVSFEVVTDPVDGHIR